MTNTEYYDLLEEVVLNSDSDKKDELVQFIQGRKEIIRNKAEKAKAKAAEKKENGDELTNVILSLLTEDFQTADEITARIEGEDVTKAKVVARLGQLIKRGAAEKTDVKQDDKRTIKAYRLVK